MQNETITIVQRTNPVLGVWRQPLVQSFINDPVTLISGVFITVVVLAVIFAPFASPHQYQELQLRLRHLPPMSTGVAEVKDTAVRGVKEERFYLLGTDHLGRDMVSRLIYGGRVSITVGVLGVLVSGGSSWGWWRDITEGLWTTS